ncbi:class I adenylate-forming enzyme family protein [Leucobacter luti]|uniref:class I adenylate-forming enzyme family protein n=1 Tax=Leucobacter luti TaxID=340320 RepID=UPI003D046F07
MTHELSLAPEIIADYTARGWWGELTVADYVAVQAERVPEKTAYVCEGRRLSWRDYDAQIDELASILAPLLEPGARFGLLLPDAEEFHVALCAAERSGTVAVGMGARSGRGEIHHLMSRAEARVLVMRAEHRDHGLLDYASDLREDGWQLDAIVEVAPAGPQRLLRWDGERFSEAPMERAEIAEVRARALGPNDLSMLNSTSGTTGRPKLVTQFANRWIHFSDLAFAAADFTEDDVMLGAVPGPFGFGLWSAHYAPAMLGMTTVLTERFSAEETIRLLQEERVTILACVSTQFKMMLDTPAIETAEGLVLRAMFTGGEAVPYERATQFEDRVGASVLQFYGSNESGAISATSLRDTREHRLKTAGRVYDHIGLRLYDPEGNDITATGGPGIPAILGPTISMGYFGDDAANEELFRDGRLLMPDLVTVDADGYLRVVGRTSDLIIRGGKNISAVEVEEAVEAHPSVVMASAVPVPDPIFGERIGVAVTVRDRAVTVAELTAFLAERGASKHIYPEKVVVVDELPRAAGGKVAKGQVRELVAAPAGVDVDLRAGILQGASSGAARA